MVEVFITNIDEAKQVKRTTSLLEANFADLRFNLDLDDSKQGTDFPCRHTVLRAEGNAIDAQSIIEAVNRLGYRCEILEDKICN